MRVALVHDYLNQYGGAERLLEVVAGMFPDAPIYTTLYDERATRGRFAGREIRTSFLQRVPLAGRYHHAFSLLMPWAVETLDVSWFDLVISVSSSFAKGVITRADARHISICLTPPRYLWDDSHRYIAEFRLPRVIKSLLPPFLSYLRVWDRQASARPTRMLAISEYIQHRILAYYQREAPVLYPPIDTDKFHISKTVGDYFLAVGRLVTYKKFDLLIRVFNDLGWPLTIVGTGVDEHRLRRMAKSNIQFVGAISDERLADLYSRCRTLVFPQEEDFGLVPLETLASGRPVLAFGGGGALETIVPGVTGEFFDAQTPLALRRALEQFDDTKYSPQDCRDQAEKFSVKTFQNNFRRFIEH